MQKLFEDGFAYNHEANKQFIEVLVDYEIENNRVIEIFSHILNAHRIWLNRIQATTTATPAVWQLLNKADFVPINQQLYHDTDLFLQPASNLNLQQAVEYVNSKGEQFTNTVQEIYFHILTHSAYHRGQIALLLRSAGINPPLSDYILYKRKQQ